MSDSRRRSGGSGNDRRSFSAKGTSCAGAAGAENPDSGSNKGCNKNANHDRVRRIVQEEGRAARNLIAWNVPIEDTDKQTPALKSSSTSRSPHKRIAAAAGSVARESSPSVARRAVLPDDASRSSGSRASSAAGGRKADLRARYWAFLFDNLKRAVDEIYRTCESDESVDECKEVMLMLEQCIKDFRSLISQWNVIKEYECAEESGKRPTSLAWDLRKTSPGKPLPHDRVSVSSPGMAQAQGLQLQTAAAGPSDSHGRAGSWAEKAKGKQERCSRSRGQPVQDSPRPPTTEPPVGAVKPAPVKPEQEDADGWETVRRSKSKASPCGSVGSLNGGRFLKPGTESECSYSSEAVPQHSGNNSLTPGSMVGPDTSASIPRHAAMNVAWSEKQGSGSTTGSKATKARTIATLSARTSHQPERTQRPAKGSRPAAPASAKAGPVRPALAGSARATGKKMPAGQTNARQNGAHPDAADPTASPQPPGVASYPAAADASLLPCSGLPNSYRDAALGIRPGSARSSRGEAVISGDLVPAAVSNGTPSTEVNVLPSISDNGITKELHNIRQARGDADTREPAVSASPPAESLVNKSNSNVEEPTIAITGMEQKVMDTECTAEDMAVVDDGQIDVRPQEEYGEEQGADNEDEVSIEQELENAYSMFESVLKEEDMLDVELIIEQEEALETAIMEEANYLEEIKQAEQALCLDGADTELANGTNAVDADSLGASQESAALDWDSLVANYESEREKKKTLGLTWGDMVDEAESGSRTPGRGAHLHEKLSSPSRKRSLTDSKRRYEERQEKARELRQKFNSEKAERLKELFKKVEEVRAWKEELMHQKRLSMECKLQSAEEKRSQQLRLKVKKAHEEENKAHEIAFINSLEAQNKRHEILSRHQGVETRLQDRQGERQKKIDEKAAKEQAAEDRRRALDAERAARLLEMQERRRQREEKIGQQLQEREKERLEAAKVREREHRDRLAALEMQQQTHVKELQKKIQHKQEESARRHDQNLQHIREKAFVMSIMKHSTEDHNDAPELVPYDTKKLCIVCDVLIPSEVHLLSHLRGKKHAKILKEHSCGQDMSRNDIESFNLKHIQDAPGDCPDPRAEQEKERHKTQKKRSKKLRQRMAARGHEYEAALAQKQEILDSPYKAKINKAVRDISKYLQTEDKGPWPQSRVSALDRSLGELARIIENKSSQEQSAFRAAGGFNVLSRILLLVLDGDDATPVIPLKCAVNACNIIRFACKGSYENCYHVLFSNRIGPLIDLLMLRLTAMLPDSREGITVSLGSEPSSSTSAGAGTVSSMCTVVHVALDSIAPAVTQALATLLTCLASYGPLATRTSVGEKVTSRNSTSSVSSEAFASRASDVVSYMVSVGIIDKLHRAFTSIRGSLDEEPALSQFIQHGLNLLTAATRLIARGRMDSIFEQKSSVLSATATGATTSAAPAATSSCCAFTDDVTGLMQTFAATELVGIVSLLYSALLAGGRSLLAPDRPALELPSHTIGVVTTGLRLINHVAGGYLGMLQSVLGEEGVSLQFRHIASHLIWYCSGHTTNEEMLHETILCVGYFTVLSSDNQALVQTGQPPTVLQQLCLLPFQYFSDPRLVAILYPTLIACCYESAINRKVIEQELSCELLANYIEEQQLEAQRDKLSSSSTSSASARKNAQGKDKASDNDGRIAFAQRFPRPLWTAAQEYFASTS